MAQGNNFVSEWFGHRLYPRPVSNGESLRDQRNQRCPFLSAATGESRECIKTQAAKGVCTISSTSNGPRQDWVVCPYRAFDRRLMEAIAQRLYRSDRPLRIYAAPALASRRAQREAEQMLDAGERVLVYFDLKMGGEIQVRPTAQSPQIAFDTTFVELIRQDGGVTLGRFAIVEVQTMDFHGSYRKAVDNLQAALRLHEDMFPVQVEANPRWLSEKIEGPNIANVFKRTFWQMMFKFEMAVTPSCAGVALAIPTAVWGSWQKFLGAPALSEQADGTFHLDRPGREETDLSALIYVFDFDETAPMTPSPMHVSKIIRTNAAAISDHALVEAPKGAIETLNTGIYPMIRRRLREFWPIQLELPVAVEDDGNVSIREDPQPVDEIFEAEPE